MKEIIINNQKVVFEHKGEQIFCTSLDIARVFEKRHDHILRDIEKTLSMMRNLGYLEQLSNFGESFYEQQLGYGAKRNNKLYTLNRDAFSLVAMGFTGEKALKWKIAFINAFNAMEKELRAIQNTSNTLLEQPKELYNLNFKTKCRDVVLNDVKKLEKEHGAKCVKVNYYRVEEIYENGKINSTVEIGADYDTPVKIDNPNNKLIRRRR